MKFQAKNEKDKESVEAKVSANVETGGGKVDIAGQFKKLAEAASDISTLSVSYFATSKFTTVSTDITSLIKAIKDFPKLVSQFIRLVSLVCSIKNSDSIQKLNNYQGRCKLDNWGAY